MDAQSAAVLEAYLDRYHRDIWGENVGAQGPSERSLSTNVNISREEACKILGVAVNANREQIVEAHRHLIHRVHPDRGGSAYLAAQLNRAKDILLRTTDGA